MYKSRENGIKTLSMLVIQFPQLMAHLVSFTSSHTYFFPFASVHHWETNPRHLLISFAYIIEYVSKRQRPLKI